MVTLNFLQLEEVRFRFQSAYLLCRRSLYIVKIESIERFPYSNRLFATSHRESDILIPKPIDSITVQGGLPLNLFLLIF